MVFTVIIIIVVVAIACIVTPIIAAVNSPMPRRLPRIQLPVKSLKRRPLHPTPLPPPPVHRTNGRGRGGGGDRGGPSNPTSAPHATPAGKPVTTHTPPLFRQAGQSTSSVAIDDQSGASKKPPFRYACIEGRLKISPNPGRNGGVGGEPGGFGRAEGGWRGVVVGGRETVHGIYRVHVCMYLECWVECWVDTVNSREGMSICTVMYD